jgi:hypothetical protein
MIVLEVKATMGIFDKLKLGDKGMVEAAIAIAVGLIVLVAIFAMAPVIGNAIDGSASIPAGSQWNATENTDIPTGVDVWSQNASMLMIAVLISILSLVILTIMNLRAGPPQQ